VQSAYTYDLPELKTKFEAIIKRHLSNDNWNWCQEKAGLIYSAENTQSLYAAFGATPRKTGKELIELLESEASEILTIRLVPSLQSWTIDRLVRVWFLMHLDASDELKYIETIETLFLSAEMNEQVALYSALPLLAHSKTWTNRCAEGVRSNIGDVLESIMCNNPYPSENLDEPAWNQLVLKAIFTEKPIHQIINLDRRSNQNLANTLSDYAHERWAANRQVHPLLWRCVGNYINEKIFSDIEQISVSPNPSEREAAALVCSQNDYSHAKNLLRGNSELREIIESGMTWDKLAKKLEMLTQNI